MIVQRQQVSTPDKKRYSYELDNILMKKGREMYIFYSYPSREWRATETKIQSLRIGRLLHEADVERLRKAKAKRLEREVTEVPRLVPIRFTFIKSALERFKVWRQKKQQQNFENWLFKEN